MPDPETTTVFAGVDGRTDAQLPSWYARRHPDADPTSFAEAIRDLPRATATTVAYENPYSGEWIETGRFNAIIEPNRIREQARGEDVDPLFHVPSNSYAVINPVDVQGAIANADHAEVRMDSALPRTKRIPPTVQYEPETHALRCTRCDNRYDPSADGMRRAIGCCSSLEEVNPDDVPICDLNLKLTPEERAEREYSDAQMAFLQAVYNAQQLRYDPIEYDILHDSMLRLQEYVDVENDEVEDLIDDGMLRHDTDHPHRLYTVTPEGRAVIGESYRRGVDYGHGQGDLEESSEHVYAVEVGRQYLEAAYASDPESPVVAVIPYFDIDEGRRLDVAGVDAEGDPVVAAEAERINHDVTRAVPEDFDKMADCDVEAAIWLVPTQDDAHTVLAALNDPPEGPVRVEKTYSENTPPQQFTIDTPGLTAIYTAEYVRDRLLG